MKLFNKKILSIIDSRKTDLVFVCFSLIFVYSLIFSDLELIQQLVSGIFISAVLGYMSSDSFRKFFGRLLSFSLMKDGQYFISKTFQKVRFCERFYSLYNYLTKGVRLFFFSASIYTPSSSLASIKNRLRYLSGCYLLFFFTFLTIHSVLFSKIKTIGLPQSFVSEMSLKGFLAEGMILKSILLGCLIGFAGFCWVKAKHLIAKIQSFRSLALRCFLSSYVLCLIAFLSIQLDFFSLVKKETLFLISSFRVPEISVESSLKAEFIPRIVLWIFFLGFAAFGLFKIIHHFTEKAKQFRRFSLQLFFGSYVLFLCAFMAVHLNVFSQVKGATFSFISAFTLPEIHPEISLRAEFIPRVVLWVFFLGFAGFGLFKAIHHFTEKAKQFKQFSLQLFFGSYVLFLSGFVVVHFNISSQVKTVVSSFISFLAFPEIHPESSLKAEFIPRIILWIFFVGFAGSYLWKAMTYLIEKGKQFRWLSWRRFFCSYFAILGLFIAIQLGFVSQIKTLSSSVLSSFTFPQISSDNLLSKDFILKAVFLFVLLALFALRIVGGINYLADRAKSFRKIFLRSFLSIYLLFLISFLSIHFTFFSDMKEVVASLPLSLVLPSVSLDFLLRGSSIARAVLAGFLLGFVGFCTLSLAQYLIGKTKQLTQLSLRLFFSSYLGRLISSFTCFVQKINWIAIQFSTVPGRMQLYLLTRLLHPLGGLLFLLRRKFEDSKRIFVRAFTSLWTSFSRGVLYARNRRKSLFLSCILGIWLVGIFSAYNFGYLKPFSNQFDTPSQEIAQKGVIDNPVEMKSEAEGLARFKPTSTSPLQTVFSSIAKFSSLSPAKEVSSPEIASQPLALSLSQKSNQQEMGRKSRIPVPKRMILSHNGGYGNNSGISYGADYSTLGVFLAPDYAIGSFYPLIDLRAHRFDNDTYAATVGAGFRYIPAPNTFCEMIGGNVFYDWRQGFLNQYNQLGVGIEILGRRWDFRANGYFPVGAKSFQYTCQFDYEGGYTIVNQKKEITTYGFNAEVGYLAITSESENFLLYLAAGPYYLTTKSCCFGFDPIRGGKFRMRPQYRDYFAVDLSVSYDSVFKTVWETVFIVSLPLYQITNQNERPCCLTDRQIYQPIERLDTMSLGTKSCWSQNY